MSDLSDVPAAPAPLRRASRPRIAQLVTDVAVVKNDASYVRTEFAKLVVAMDRALARIEATTADANASPAGRELLRRAGRAEERLKDVEDDVTSLKMFRTEVKTATRVLYLLATVSSGSAILALLAVAAHVADPHLP